MSNDIHWVQWRADAYIAGTFGLLTLEEHGLYTIIINLIYSRRGPIENDRKRFVAACNGTHWRTVQTALDGLIAKEKILLRVDGLISNNTCERMLAGAQDRFNNSSRAAQEAAKTRSRRAQAEKKSSEINTHNSGVGSYLELELELESKKERIGESLTGERGAQAQNAPAPNPAISDQPSAQPSNGVDHDKRPRRGQRLPTGWQIDAELETFARGLGLDPVEQHAAFVDYWAAASGSRAAKLDWRAAFRTWCRRSAERPSGHRARPGAAANAPSSETAAIRRAVDLVKARQRVRE